ncbi:MAG: CoB--CoM heterodisulfide reductase iron-sulfur subunit A family protein [Desulfomonile tiedjei]|uniref:CoB--CoM heterodisulfide reductase iron-sulfur subunit A family protein n=1 Tax=Desulfomonile tiedjei TaxID=2358 RepID=A0A9D6Z420_9BACT|nr:CoB--CoM heterodisulfide reductase iron-sulfur subunit A family protein [Desulfomonile tiedjei]
MDKPIVVVGGGIAGLSVAGMLAGNGMRCIIVEREASLGGHVRDWACMATDKCLRCFCCSAEDLVGYARSSDKIDVRTGWELSSVSLSSGGPKQAVLKRIGSAEEKTEEAAALVIATGFEPYNPGEKILLGHGRLDGVFTLAEMDSLLRRDMLSVFTRGRRGLRAAFFQCVGSRDANSGANYCSQYCCKAALRMALKLMHESPDISVTLFYIDIQLAGKYAGALLKAAEDKGVRLQQGVPGEITNSEDLLEVIVESQGLNRKEPFDRVILSIGERPSPKQSVLDQLGLPANEFGFVSSRDPLDNSRTAIPGVYVAGTCSGPKDIETTLEHAGQTAEVIMADLRKGALR